MSRGAKVDNRDLLIIGNKYCVGYKNRPDIPCIFATYDRCALNVHLFKRLVRSYDYFEPEIFGGWWKDLDVYNVIENDNAEDPRVVENEPVNADPMGGGRRRKTRHRRRRKSHRNSRH